MPFAGCTRRLLGAWLALCSTGCMAVLGDFELEEPAPPPSGLGTVCEPSSFRCSGSRLEACNADRRGWQLIEICASAGQCDASAVACRNCAPGEAACNGRERQLCNALGELETVEPCEEATLCRVAGDRSSAACGAPLCNTGDFFCDGNRLRTCAPSRDHWTLVARCASGPLCNAAHATDHAAAGAPPTCLPPLCLPGTFACDGATPQRCAADQNAWEPLAPCADAASCNAGDGSCIPAPDGTIACSGAALVAKGADGFAPLDDCGSAELCDASLGECLPATCGEPGSLRCSDEELPSLEECTGNGTWAVREVCATRALCSTAAGRCLEPACELAATRCVGQQFQVCSADLTHWELDSTCNDEFSCGPAGCEAASCVEGAARCVEASLEVCSAGRWEPRLRCATAELCNAPAGRCNDPMCGGPLGDYTCMERRLLKCPPSRVQWQEFRTCTPPTGFCDPEPVLGMGAPVCAACEPLSYACAGTSLTRCAADGQSSLAIASCPGGCVVGSGMPSCLTL